MKNERVNFGSKLGAILAAAGSAVGLGNIWRFPYETGNHGGAAFILVYLGCVFLLGLPIMIAEFTVGRRSKASTGKAFGVLAPGTQWKWIGFLGGFIIAHREAKRRASFFRGSSEERAGWAHTLR